MAGRRRELNNTPAILLIIGLRLKDSRDYLFYRIQPQKGEGMEINKNVANGNSKLASPVLFGVTCSCQIN